jgi:alkylation response protein AidB-like acyl-CoA dehydrogenase
MTESTTIEQFAAEAKAFLDANLEARGEEKFVWGEGDDSVGVLDEQTPEEERAELAAAKAWKAEEFDAGFGWITGPEEYGGRALTADYERRYRELTSGYKVPSTTPFGIGLGMVAPTILAHATPEVREAYLRKMHRGDIVGCQLFSEPIAGSDLAGIQTKAERDGDEWVVTGQKVWTSGAQWAKWCMLVARTDPDAPKHKGLTYFLMDMEQEGVQVRPLRQITGGAEFNELFLEGARIPDANVIGGVGNGWKVALTTLMNERAGLAFFLQVRMRQLLDDVIEEAASRGLLEDPLVADKLADLHVKAEILRLTAYRGLTAIEKYGQPGPEGSLTKWLWSDTNQQLTQLAADLFGDAAFTSGNRWAYELLRARGNSIEGGTTEILKNIIAERVLGLPRLK